MIDARQARCLLQPARQHAFLAHEMIRGQHHNGGIRIASYDVQQGKQKTRCGTFVLRLNDDIFWFRRPERRLPPASVLSRDHGHHVPALRNGFRTPQGLLQQGRAALQRTELFGDVESAGGGGQTAQPAAFAGGKYHTFAALIATRTLGPYRSVASRACADGPCSNDPDPGGPCHWSAESNRAAASSAAPLRASEL